MVIKRQEVEQNLMPLCRPCHMFIHKAFTHKELALNYNTPEKLRAHPLVENFTGFIERRAIGKRIKGKQVIIEGGMVTIKGFPSTFSSLDRSLEMHKAVALIDEFFRRKNWQRSGT
jgi:hypothetical protein